MCFPSGPGSGFICKAGYTLSSFLDDCIPCPSGSFKAVDGNGTCLQCPVGAECFGSGLTQFKCSIGFEKNSAEIGCESCVNGTFKNSAGDSVCTQCVSTGNCTNGGLVCNNAYELNAHKTTCVSCGSSCSARPPNMDCSTNSCKAGFQRNSTNNGC